MRLAPEIRSQLVHILYSAMPQVVSSTSGTVLLSCIIWWRIQSPWTAALIAAAIVVMIVRVSTLLAYRRTNGDVPPQPAKAISWERLYGAFSIAMAFVLGAVMLTAFLRGDRGVQLLSSGVAIGISGGQSTARVTCRPWIPLTSGTIILGALTVCAAVWTDPLSPLFVAFAILYLYTYIEACRHSARTILGRLVAEAELAALVRRDPLTGLANRIGFEEELDRALNALARNKGAVSLLMLDLDGFKAVNDELGHPAGDAVLREVADRLRKLSRRTDYVARIGGDELAIVVTDRHDQEGVSDYAQRLIAGISEPYALADRVIRIGVSIGISTAYYSGPETSAELLASADSALYKVKRTSKNGFAFGDPITRGSRNPGSTLPTMEATRPQVS